MKNFTTLLLCLISFNALSQIGINTTLPSGMLDVSSTTNGFLLPRVSLTSSIVQAPIVNPQGGSLATSTLVYNFATVPGVNGVSPGYYYWDGLRWVSFTGNNSRDWSLEGNTSIINPANPATYGTSTIGATENFFGTADANDIVLGTNRIERMRLKHSTGNLGIGTANPLTKLDILSPGNTLGLRILSGNATQISYLSLGRTFEYAQIGAATAGTFFTDALDGDMAVKNFNTGKILFGASFIDSADMSIVPGGFIGINNSNPGTLFDIRGINNWNTSTTEGDFRIGDPTFRLKIGVATGGGGAGDIRISAQGGTNRIFLGSATNTTLATIDGLNNRVGIKNVLLPNSVLDINGDFAMREGPALALANTTFPIITLPAGNEYSHYRVTGPTIPFFPYLINGGNDGQVLTLINDTGQNMNIWNFDSADGIITGTGNNLSSTSTSRSSVTMIYNSTLSRWIVKSYTGMSDNRNWSLFGNNVIITPAIPTTYGTSLLGATENFIGTIGANDVVFGTNNIERMRLKLNTGNLGVGTANPFHRLHVSTPNAGAVTTLSENVFVGTSDGTGLYGRALNNPGYGYGGIFDGGYMAVRSNASGGTYAGAGYGGYFLCTGTAGSRYGVWGEASGAVTNFGGYFTAVGGTNNYGLVVANGNTGIGNVTPDRAKLQTQGAVGNTVATFNLNVNSLGIAMVSDWPGIYFNSYFNGGVRQMSGGSFPAMFNYNPGGQFEFALNNTANTVAGNLTGGTFVNRFTISRDTGATFYYTNPTATGLNVVSGNHGPNLTFFDIGAIGAAPQNGKGITTGGEYVGVEGRANYGFSPTIDRMGGLFYVSSTGVNAVATVGSVVDNIVYKILGFGTVNTLVRDDAGKERIMAAPEAPEALFQDYGIATLVNGYAKIDIDPVLTKNIRVDETHPMKVFIQLEGDCKGVYVFNKTATSFEVKELQSGNSNVTFSYQIVAFRADEERGGHLSKYSDMRFKPLNRELKVVEKEMNFESQSSKNMKTVEPEIIPSPEVREIINK